MSMPGALLEELAREVADAADAGRPVRELAGLCFARPRNPPASLPHGVADDEHRWGTSRPS
jgi:hypothetical protein